jgi:hypothetical protein
VSKYLILFCHGGLAWVEVFKIRGVSEAQCQVGGPLQGPAKRIAGYATWSDGLPIRVTRT